LRTPAPGVRRAAIMGPPSANLHINGSVRARAAPSVLPTGADIVSLTRHVRLVPKTEVVARD
jgi:hypothetical protein